MKRVLRFGLPLALLAVMLVPATLAGADAPVRQGTGLSSPRLISGRFYNPLSAPTWQGQAGSPPGLWPPTFGTDVRISFDNAGAPHNEFFIAVNPTNANNWLTGANDYGPTSTTGYYYTTNGGASWSGQNFLGPYPGGAGINPGGDPVGDFDAAGTAYFTDLGYSLSNLCTGGVYIHKSTDGGATWASAVQAAASSTSPSIFLDKDWMGTDKHAGSPYINRVYVSYTKFAVGTDCNLGTYTSAAIYLKWSSDGGTTWSSEASVSPPTDVNDQGSNIVTASDGTVYVAYQYQPLYPLVPTNQMLAKSTDGGQTFSAPSIIAGGPISLTGAVSTTGYQYLIGGNSNSWFRNADWPYIGVSPTDSNTVYAVWEDGRWDTSFTCCGIPQPGQHADIAFSKSSDGGATWTAPVRLNDDPQGNGKDQWFPYLAVSNDGAIHVMWSDRRDDPNNFNYKQYYTVSTDGGNTWAADVAVSDVAINPNTGWGTSGEVFIGDYSGLGATQLCALGAWLDTHLGFQAEFTDPGCQAPTSVKLADFRADQPETRQPSLLWLALGTGVLLSGIVVGRRLQQRGGQR